MAGQDTRIRGDLAQKLRDKVDRSFSDHFDEHVLVLGDFNDNPYDLSLTHYLRATRDINLAQRNPNLLYNPFWRPLINRSLYKKGDELKSSSGSYLYDRSNETHQWHVFDQILVSHGLLGSSRWHLNEAETGVLDRIELHGISLEPKSGFDHYPVIALLEKDQGE